MSTLTSWVIVAAFIILVSSFITERGIIRYSFQIYQKISRKVLLEAFLMTIVTGSIVLLFMQLSALQFSWMIYVFGANVNLLLDPLLVHTYSEGTVNWILGGMLYAFLMIVLPFYAQFEERIFRKGGNTWRKIILRAIGFGLIHAVFGVPLLGAFAVMALGLFLGVKYKNAFEEFLEFYSQTEAEQQAVEVSTVYHTAYNVIIVTVLFLSSVTLLVLTG